jgi:uncharacterized membrane protein YkgB
MDSMTATFTSIAALQEDRHFHLIRASMVIVFFFFGYQAFLNYEIRSLIPFIHQRTLTLWLYPAFGALGGSWLPGTVEWLLGLLILLGFLNRKMGICGAIGSCLLLASALTILALKPDAEIMAMPAHPAMTRLGWVLEDIVLILASLYLLRQDWSKLSLSRSASSERTGQTHLPRNGITSETL